MFDLRALLLILLCGIHASTWAGGFFSPERNSTPDFLPGDEAFVLEALATAPGLVEARWIIAPGYYLYKHRLQVQMIEPDQTPVAWEAPPGIATEDEHFGMVEIYHDSLSLPIKIATTAASVTLNIAYQGCAEAGLCYPPTRRSFVLDMPPAP